MLQRKSNQDVLLPARDSVFQGRSQELWVKLIRKREVLALGDQSPKSPGIFRFVAYPKVRERSCRTTVPLSVYAPNTALGLLPGRALSSGSALSSVSETSEEQQ